jgi:hypothetical protein
MKFLPSTTDPNSFGWENFLLLLSVVAIPSLAFFIWIAFFRQKHPHRRKRHRRRSSSDTEFARNLGLPSASRPNNPPGEPKS